MITRCRSRSRYAPRGRGRIGGRLAATAVALRDVGARPPLRRAEVAYGLACTSDAAFTVTLGVVAFREGGAAAVGLVALLRMLPSALGSTVLTAYADRLRRERVLVVASVVRAAALAADRGRSSPPARPRCRSTPWPSSSPPR